jgi:hypothetical protein
MTIIELSSKGIFCLGGADIELTNAELPENKQVKNVVLVLKWLNRKEKKIINFTVIRN